MEVQFCISIEVVSTTNMQKKTIMMGTHLMTPIIKISVNLLGNSCSLYPYPSSDFNS